MTASDLMTRITIDPKVQHGKPCVKGTRTPVHVILEALATGASSEQVKREFPPLTDDDLKAVLLFAAYLANEKQINPPHQAA